MVTSPPGKSGRMTHRTSLLTRRGFLAAAASVLAAQGSAAAGAAPLRVATVDWALLETLLAIGVVPVAATELTMFRRIAVEPEVPASVVDIGLRGSPNYEALRLARPDLVLSSNYYAWAEAKLRLVAPVERISIYGTGEQPFKAAEEATLRLGRETGQDHEAERTIAETHAELDRFRDAIAGGDGRPLLLINLGDAHHFRVFGSDSMFGNVLTRLGLRNAWTARTSYAASAPLGLETLAGMPDAWIVIIPPIPPEAQRALPRSAFWNALPNVKAGRVLTLESVNPFGGMPAGLRFARLLASALSKAVQESRS